MQLSLDAACFQRSMTLHVSVFQISMCLYSSVAERQSCKLKVLGSIPSGGLLLHARMHATSHGDSYWRGYQETDVPSLLVFHNSYPPRGDRAA